MAVLVAGRTGCDPDSAHFRGFGSDEPARVAAPRLLRGRRSRLLAGADWERTAHRCAISARAAPVGIAGLREGLASLGLDHAVLHVRKGGGDPAALESAATKLERDGIAVLLARVDEVIE